MTTESRDNFDFVLGRYFPRISNHENSHFLGAGPLVVRKDSWNE
jgi:hypothetical protein